MTVPASSDDLLFTNLDGSMVGLDEVIADGLDRDYSGRYHALRTLLEEGSARHRLHACVMLASWGVRDGLLTIVDWAGTPDEVPWAGAPVSFDRMFGADDAFAHLAGAVSTAGHVEMTPVGVRLRVAATRALLLLYDRAYFDRSMPLLFDLDDNLAVAVRPQLQQAVQGAVAASRMPQKFDMPTQAALLLGPLAAVDDQLAASLASELTVLARDWPRTLREVACGLGSGSGSATLFALRRLARSTHKTVASEAQEWLKRREVGSG